MKKRLERAIYKVAKKTKKFQLQKKNVKKLQYCPTSRVTNIACPICNEPVTLGGGIEITNGSLPVS